MNQLTLFAAPTLPDCQQEIVEALGHITGPADTHQIQQVLANHDIPRDRNCIAKRLGELEALGHVERAGRNYARKGNPTTWRRK